MYNFIVSGFIPGTNIQLTFNTYLYCICLVAVYMVYRRYRLYRSTAPAERQPLPASQLHRRLHLTAR